MPEKMTGSKAFFGVLDDEDAYRLICPVDRPAERSIRGMAGFISLVWLTFDGKLQVARCRLSQHTLPSGPRRLRLAMDCY
jgi:hypothetical protein